MRPWTAWVILLDVYLTTAVHPQHSDHLKEIGGIAKDTAGTPTLLIDLKRQGRRLVG